MNEYITVISCPECNDLIDIRLTWDELGVKQDCKCETCSEPLEFAAFLTFDIARKGK